MEIVRVIVDHNVPMVVKMDVVIHVTNRALDLVMDHAERAVAPVVQLVQGVREHAKLDVKMIAQRHVLKAASANARPKADQIAQTAVKDVLMHALDHVNIFVMVNALNRVEVGVPKDVVVDVAMHVKSRAKVHALMVVVGAVIRVVERDVIILALAHVLNRVRDHVVVKQINHDDEDGDNLCHKHHVDVEQVVTLYVERLVRALNQLKHIRQRILLSYGLRQRRLVEVIN